MAGQLLMTRRARASTLFISRHHLFGFTAAAADQSPKLKHYRDKRVVSYSAEQMFNIVNAVEKYPDFVPWCKRVITRNVAERVAEYELSIGFPPLIQEHYTSRVTTLRPNVIHAVCTEGRLFDVFDTTWRFGPGPHGPGSCTLMFTLDFRFTNAVYASLSGIVFNQIVNKMVCAFLKRAEQLHGPVPEILEYDCDST